MAVSGSRKLPDPIALAVPPRGEPEVLIRWLIGAQAGASPRCAASPSLTIAIVTRGVLGLANAPLVTATFAARSR